MHIFLAPKSSNAYTLQNSCIKFIFLINYFLNTKNTFSELISTLVSIPPFELMEKVIVLEMTLEIKLFFF